MNGLGSITRAIGLVKRLVFTRKVDTITAVRQRHSDFNALRDRICEMGTDHIESFGHQYKFEGGLSLQQNPDELAALCFFLKEHGPYRNYLEIGSASGGTCRFLHETVGFRNAISLDDRNHPRAREQANNFRAIRNLKQFIGDSHSDQARAFVADNLEGKLNVAFIDGDHSFEGVWQDIQLVLPFCRKGALVIFHDTVACEGVRQAWMRSVMERQLRPRAEYIGEERSFGISINSVR